MAKAIVCVGSTQVSAGVPHISYSVSVLSTVPFSYGSDYTVDTSSSVAANLLAWRNKVIAQAAEQHVILAVGDVIVFGAPT